jgi:hypothetical protein
MPANVLFSYSVVKELRQQELGLQLTLENFDFQGVHLVENTGFEPVTSALQGRRSPS